MAFVKQRNKVDCGVACLAMLCNVTYEEAHQAIEWRPSSAIHGTDTGQLREAAERLGYEGVGTTYNQLMRLGKKGWEDIPSNSLVKLPHPNPKFGMWHWVVWKSGKVYDPARGVFKPSKHGGVPSSYMEFLPHE